MFPSRAAAGWSSSSPPTRRSSSSSRTGTAAPSCPRTAPPRFAASTWAPREPPPSARAATWGTASRRRERTDLRSRSPRRDRVGDPGVLVVQLRPLVERPIPAAVPGVPTLAPDLEVAKPRFEHGVAQLRERVHAPVVGERARELAAVAQFEVDVRDQSPLHRVVARVLPHVGEPGQPLAIRPVLRALARALDERAFGARAAEEIEHEHAPGHEPRARRPKVAQQVRALLEHPPSEVERAR